MTDGSGIVAPGRVTPPPPIPMVEDVTPTCGRLTVAPGRVTPPPPTPTVELRHPDAREVDGAAGQRQAGDAPAQARPAAVGADGGVA